MLEDIEEGELDYNEEGMVPEEIPDIPHLNPAGNGNASGSEDGEIMSDVEVSRW